MTIGRERGTDENDDSVRLLIGKSEPQRIERYSFHCSVLQQPSAFTFTTFDLRQGLKRQLTPGPTARCSLHIGKQPQFTGEIDAINTTGDANSSQMEVRGRDLMARLHDTDVTGERSFNNATFEDLFKAALTDVGQGHKIVSISNTANRRVRSGVNVKVSAEPVTAKELKATPGSGRFNTIITAKLGETWLEFLDRTFRKLGLFAWCDANGNFVLSRPNADQEPTFHFYRQRSTTRSECNVKSFVHTNDTTSRVSECVIFTRYRGKKQGHNHTSSGFEDEEMIGLGFDRRRVHRDVNVTTPEEAEFYARTKIAELNRAGWKLTYVVSGHSAPTVNGFKRAVICPDMVARVDDDDLGIHDNLYIESVEYRSPPRESVVTMMRVQDILFGELQAKKGAAKAKVKVKKEDNRTELDLLGLSRGTFGVTSDITQNAVEAKRRKAEAEAEARRKAEAEAARQRAEKKP